MPGANPRAMEKARTLPADVIVFDLEDIENLHVEDAHRVIALAGAIAAARVTIGE